ncbi:hypothetical protein LIER_37419 [Lithospermum erythrorhizon]|uniref:Uncharacterized protein n=1 Tax=Lithospermum erythrorhizon TaxID=34254 RepID=A0AAV3PKC4_LITER
MISLGVGLDSYLRISAVPKRLSTFSIVVCSFVSKRLSTFSSKPSPLTSNGQWWNPKRHPPPSPTRENSATVVVDAGTLNQVRFYTSVGAEVRYGNLLFTPYFDPFATVVLKQEATHGDIFQEIDNYPSNTLAPVTTTMGQELPAGSSHQAVGTLVEQARIQATVPLFANLFTVKHRLYETSLAAKGGGRMSKNFKLVPAPTRLVPVGSMGNGSSSGELVARKPLIPGVAAIPVFPSKRSSTSEASVAASKKAKIEALNAITTTSSSPQALQTEVIKLDDELTTAAQEAGVARKEKSKDPSSVRSSKAILPR